MKRAKLEPAKLGWSLMNRRTFALAASALVLGACMTSPATADDAVLQQAANHFVSISQHPEAVDAAEATREMDRITAQADDDPLVLRYAVLARLSLIDNMEDAVVRLRLANEGLAILDRAIALPGADGPPRQAVMAGQTVDVDLSDADGIRAMLQAVIAASR